MRTRISVATLAAMSLMACARQSRVESSGDVDMPSIPVNANSLPSGSTLEVRLDNEIGTKASKNGDEFVATVTTPVTAQNGQTVVPSGARVYGKVTGVHSSSRAGDQAAIGLAFERLEMRGQTYPFTAKVTTTNLETRGGDSRSQTIKKAGIGAAAGAAIGAILSGGDLDKILLGGALGAAAGTVISLGTGDVEGVLPAGTRMTLRTTQTVALR
jgi:hypothetical protein